VGLIGEVALAITFAIEKPLCDSQVNFPANIWVLIELCLYLVQGDPRSDGRFVSRRSDKIGSRRLIHGEVHTAYGVKAEIVEGSARQGKLNLIPPTVFKVLS